MFTTSQMIFQSVNFEPLRRRRSLRARPVASQQIVVITLSVPIINRKEQTLNL